jgi:hypothetical protein
MFRGVCARRGLKKSTILLELMRDFWHESVLRVWVCRISGKSAYAIISCVKLLRATNSQKLACYQLLNARKQRAQVHRRLP